MKYKKMLPSYYYTSFVIKCCPKNIVDTLDNMGNSILYIQDIFTQILHKVK